jgi:hypothetical protein
MPTSVRLGPAIPSAAAIVAVREVRLAGSGAGPVVAVVKVSVIVSPRSRVEGCRRLLVLVPGGVRGSSLGQASEAV